MATTFARLCQQVDLTQKELDAEIRRLTAKIHQLETVQSRSKSLRSVSQNNCFIWDQPRRLFWKEAADFITDLNTGICKVQ